MYSFADFLIISPLYDQTQGSGALSLLGVDLELGYSCSKPSTWLMFESASLRLG
jgi:hypothetical protein